MWPCCSATDLDYVILNPAAHTLQACRRADRTNNLIYERRRGAASSLQQVGMQCEQVPPPPAPNNVAQKQAWLRRHTPVPAETQALAVEALLLCVPPMLPDCDYAAENAIALARDRRLALSTAGARPAAGDGDEGLPGLIHVADDELVRLSSWRTRWIDLHNQRIYARATRQRRKLRRRTGSMVHARASVATGWTMLSHMARRAELKERSVQVSAWEQASAVVALYQTQKLRVHRDYPPQDAIALARERCSVRHAAQSPMTSSPTAPPQYPAWQSPA